MFIYENITDDTYIDEDYIRKESYMRLLEIINNLPENQRNIVYYRFVEGLSVNAVADMLKLPPGTIKSGSHYGINRLKTELKNYLIEGDYIMECRKTYEYLYQYAKEAILPSDKEKAESHISVCTLQKNR